MTRKSRVSVKGSWPGPVVLRSGWAKAAARPWNDDDPRASLRSERGGSSFIAGCAATLVDLGAPEVLSAPVFGADLPTWARAGFVKHRQLVVMRSALRAGVPARGEAVVVTPETVADLDRLAFTTDWQIGRVGIADALRATPLSVLLAIGGDRPSGFVIVGVAGTAGYLQRIAVLPSSQGRGIGRQLLRHAMSWARRAGATSMVLNTQPDNTTAIALYQSEGFATLPQRLSVMRWRGEVGESAPPPR